MSHETFKAPDLDQLAELLPAYDFDSFIAQGGMGAVYKARQRSLDREVAIKILPRELGADPEFRESFVKEAKAMAKLNHPNLLGVYDFGDIDGMPYIVMEFVGGKSLYHSAWNKAIEPEQAIEIVRKICKGLGHAHEHGILHRDIKPANILLTPKAEPKIGDFGLAQQTDAAGSGEVMGTPGYAAPELMHSPETAGVGTDIYAIGIILHELITGQRPDPTGAEQPQPYGDRALDAIWQKATDPVIANRYHTADEMAAALAAWRPVTRKLATGVHPANVKPRSLVVAGSGAPPKRPTPMASTSSKSSPVKSVLITVFLLAAIGVGYTMLNKPETKAEPAGDEPAGNLSDEPDAPISGTPMVGSSAPGTKPPDNIPPVEKDESVFESLARLKDDLLSGRRDEFPKGAQRLGKSEYLFIETPMGWYAAQQFAEEHDAHLAILESPEELTWLSNLVPDDQTVWLGSGRSERNVWTDNDGTNWDLDASPTGVGPFASLNKLGILRAGKFSDKKPFFIQWHHDGVNPGTLEVILSRTSETLDSPNPIFPPGTISVDTRRILFLPIAMKRNQADALAKMAGGYLAVPSSRDEIGWLAEKSESKSGSDGFWLGGQRKDGVWSWDSGETWENSDWIDDTEPTGGGDALVLVPGKGWSNSDPWKPASGLLIEWSNDASSGN